MKRPVIGLDLDECLGAFNATIAKFYNQLNGTNLTICDFHSFKYWEVWGGTPEESSIVVRKFFKSKLFTDGIPVIPGSKEALQKLHEKFDIIIVTSRHQDIEDETRRWIAENYPGVIDSIIIGNYWSKEGPRLTKQEMLSRIHADIFIDDNYGYVHDCKDIVKLPILFGHYGWNERQDPKDYDGIIRCSNWEQVVNLIMNTNF